MNYQSKGLSSRKDDGNSWQMARANFHHSLSSLPRPFCHYRRLMRLYPMVLQFESMETRCVSSPKSIAAVLHEKFVVIPAFPMRVLWLKYFGNVKGQNRSMPLDLHVKGSAPARNIQIEPNLIKQKCQFVCYGQVQTLSRADPMACFDSDP